MTAQMLDGTATAARDQGRAHGAGRRAARARASCPGWAPCWSATTRARGGTSTASTRTAPRSASSRSGSTCPRPPPRRRSRPRSPSSTPTRPAPATSSSCRCRAAATRTACSGSIDPAKDADGLHPTNLGWLVLGNEAPLPCTPARHRRAAAPPRRADRRRRGGRGRPRRHRRPPARPAADPPLRERHRHAVPHRHPSTWPRTCAAPTSWSPPPAYPASSPATWSSPAPPCSTSASRRVDGKLAGDVAARRVGRRRLGLAQPRRRRPDDPRDAARRTSWRWPRSSVPRERAGARADRGAAPEPEPRSRRAPLPVDDRRCASTSSSWSPRPSASRSSAGRTTGGSASEWSPARWSPRPAPPGAAAARRRHARRTSPAGRRRPAGWRRRRRRCSSCAGNIPRPARR